MSDKMKKFLDVSIKAADEAGAYWFTSSTNSRDRQGDIIVQEGWRTADFMNNPVILWGHNYYETPIGKAKEIKLSPEGLSALVQFVPESIDPFAAKVEKLVANGFLKTVSVGFMVYKREPLNADDLKMRPEMKWGERLYGDLLEISIVPVPANPEALMQEAYGDVVSRGFGLIPAERKNKLLPYQDTKGNVNPRLLRASFAAALGARGGVKLEESEREESIKHLRRIANENKILLPILDTNTDLKKEFEDVWHEELLDVLTNAEKMSEDVPFKLIQGKTRSEMIRARDALNTIIELSTDRPKTITENEVKEVESTVNSIVSDLSDITARLK